VAVLYSPPELQVPARRPFLLEPAFGGGRVGRPRIVPSFPVVSVRKGSLRNNPVDYLYAPLPELPSQRPFLALCMPRFSSVAWLRVCTKRRTYFRFLGREVVEESVELAKGTFGMQNAPALSAEVPARMVSSVALMRGVYFAPCCRRRARYDLLCSLVPLLLRILRFGLWWCGNRSGWCHELDGTMSGRR